MVGQGAAGWDARHAAAADDGGAPPSPTVTAVLAALPDGPAPRRALDLGAGLGRHARWLAARGWSVTAVDASAVAGERAGRAAAAAGLTVATVTADLTTWAGPPLPVGLALVAHVQLEPATWARVRGWLAPGGRLVVVGHAAASAEGPRDPALRHTPASARAAASGLVVERLEEVPREGGLDLVLVARRPAGAGGPCGTVGP